MRWRPASFAGRLLLGLGAAAALTAVLSLSLRGPALAAPSPPPFAPPRLAPPLPPLQPGPGPVLLCADRARLPAAAQPVLAIAADGAVRLVRAGPCLDLPRPSPLRPSPGSAAVLLPAADLARLSPAARGGLLECLGALLAARPVRPADLALAGVAAAPDELSRLLSWVR